MVPSGLVISNNIKDGLEQTPGPWSMSSWIQYPPTGLATLTHYSLPEGYVAACGCTPDSTKYPTAALSQMAFGSSANYGPGCGRCYKLSLLNPIVSTPPFTPDEIKSLVVKITDLCPLSQTGWCSGTTERTNSAGSQLNFDLAYPSKAIPEDFFPSDVALYGYKDFGVWNITYEAVSCLSSWQGRSNPKALGSVGALGTSACCPAEPTGNDEDTCPSYSDNNGLPPNTATSDSPMLRPIPSTLLLAGLVVSWLILR